MKSLFRLESVIPALWLFICPLIVGIARGSGIFVLRPNEALLLLLLAVCGCGFVWKAAGQRLILPAALKTDAAMMALVVFGTAMPLLLGIGRGTDLNSDDFLYAFVFLKYAMLYGLFRLLPLNESDQFHALCAVIASEAIVAVLALLQAKGLFGINDILTAYYDAPFEGSSVSDSLRASSTIASSFGLADSMTIALSLVIALLASNSRLPIWQKACLGLAGLLFAIATLAAGSFTGVIGCVVAVLCVGILTGRLQQIFSLAAPVAALGGVLLWPTISARLDGFSGYRSMPRSWIGRLDNLETYFWPEIFNGWNWLLGVRPAARVPAPESWRDWVYIESGYTWLLWTGGLPLALAFFCFLWCVFSDLILDSRLPMRQMSPMAIAAFAGTTMIAINMVFDPHLTVRGCADLYFPLLAIALAGCAKEREFLPAMPRFMRASITPS